ncbi:MAG: GTP 3',8-cyclase MoaA [Lachnospirales bacterium]
MVIGRDSYGRKIDYMRISVTDRCNLRCIYCNPQNTCENNDILSFDEIVKICKEAVKLGISKIKITGGEPLLRENCHILIKDIKNICGIKEVTLTTNGVLLYDYAKNLFESGLDGINISLDSVNREKYKLITGFDVLYKVLKGIDEVYKYNIPIKINTVITDTPDYNIVKLSKDRNISVRFIEMMPIGCGKNFKVYPNDVVLKELENIYGNILPDSTKRGNGPAKYYKIKGFKGSIGFIGAIHNKFCNSCNRIRLTSNGTIKNCLCYESNFSLKEAVKSDDSNKIYEILLNAIYNKPLGHSFDKIENITEHCKMSEIGG